MPDVTAGLPRGAAFAKRSFDILLSAIGLALAWPVIFVAFVVASVDTGANGFFTQCAHRALRQALQGRQDPDDAGGLRHGVDGDDSVGLPCHGRRTRHEAGEDRRVATALQRPGRQHELRRAAAGYAGLRRPPPGRGSPRPVGAARHYGTGDVKTGTRRYCSKRRQTRNVTTGRVIYPDKVRLNRKYVECYRFAEDLRLLALTFFTRREG